MPMYDVHPYPAIQIETLSPAPQTPHLIPASGSGRRLYARRQRIATLVQQIISEGRESGNYVLGRRVALLEHRLLETWGAGPAPTAAYLATNSGSSALWAALECLSFPAGSEVIVPSYTFFSTANAVSNVRCPDAAGGHMQHAGLTVVFVDVDPVTSTLSPQAVAAALTSRTVALIPVHLHGLMADMRPLLDLATREGLTVIEDAAQAHGATYQQQAEAGRDHSSFAGTLGDFGCYSLAPVKNMGSLGADAGAIAISARQVDQHPGLLPRLRAWRNVGRLSAARYAHEEAGQRARMDELSAAELLDELTLLPAWNTRRRAIAARFTAALSSSSLGVQPPVVPAGRGHVFFTYAVCSPGVEARAELERRLTTAHIEVVDAYTLVSEQWQYRTGRFPCRIECLDASRALAPRITLIPCYPELEDTEIARIEEVLAS
ncbi:MAG: DegT/DnrJ/EryC1/StrS family aminotransferase [Ktedonobacteraceae bacterium]